VPANSIQRRSGGTISFKPILAIAGASAAAMPPPTA
jgi:hypothetical protein